MIRALVTYTDWWQPTSTSVILVGGARRTSGVSDGIPLGLLSRLDERSELCARMDQIPERDRQILFLWYVRQLSVDEIAREVKLSRRQCFRRRAEAVRSIVRLGEPDQGVA